MRPDHESKHVGIWALWGAFVMVLGLVRLFVVYDASAGFAGLGVMGGTICVGEWVHRVRAERDFA